MDLGNSIIALSLQFKPSSFMQTPTVFILQYLPGGEFVVRYIMGSAYTSSHSLANIRTLGLTDIDLPYQ